MEQRAVWPRLPVIVRAVVTGSAATVAGTIPWALLVVGAAAVGAYAALASVARPSPSAELRLGDA